MVLSIPRTRRVKHHRIGIDAILEVKSTHVIQEKEFKHAVVTEKKFFNKNKTDF